MRTLVAILAIWQAEARNVTRRISSVLFLIVMPLVLIVITSDAFAFVLGESDLGLVVVDIDRSPRSEALIVELRETEGVDVHEERWAEGMFGRSDAERLIDDVGGAAALLVPRGYGDNPSGPTLTLYADPVQAGLSAVLRDRVERAVAASEVAETTPDAVSAAGGGVSASEVRAVVERTLDEPPIAVQAVTTGEEQAFPSAFEQSVPGFAVMFSLYLAGFAALLVHNEKREWGTWRRALVAPLPAWTVLGAKMLVYAGLGVLQLGVLFLLGWVVWGLSLGDSPAALLSVMAAVGLVTAGFGLWLSAYAGRSSMLILALSSLAVFALGVIGGAMVPVFLLPGWMQFVSRATPHFWALDAFQDIMIRGQGLVDVLPSLAIVLAFAAGLFAAALARFRFVD